MNEAKESWFGDNFVAYNDKDCDYLFGQTATEFYQKDIDFRANEFIRILSRFRDSGNIAINIHTSPDDATSSLGCQNIPISDYPGFIKVLDPQQTHFLYTLVDASKVEGIE